MNIYTKAIIYSYNINIIFFSKNYLKLLSLNDEINMN